MDKTQITGKLPENVINELGNSLVDTMLNTFTVIKTIFVPLFSTVMPWFIGLGLLIGIIYVIIGKIRGRGI